VTDEIAAIVLAAGRGKRLKSKRPKVLHEVAGRALVAHVVARLGEIGIARMVVVGPTDIRPLEEALAPVGARMPVELVIQDPPRGTGDAVRIAMGAMGNSAGPVIVANGDTPLVTTSTLRGLLDLFESSGAGAALLTARVADPSGLGRIVRGDGDRIAAIVEEADADETEKAIDEINGGIYVFRGDRLRAMLDKVDAENAQGEYYLTDVVELLVSSEDVVVAFTGSEEEIAGVNTRGQLAHVTAATRERIVNEWMEKGVSIVDPASTFIDASVEIEADATILPFTFLEGDTKISAGAEIGPQTRIIDSEVGPDATVTFAVVRGSVIGPEASVGPFASLRPGTRLDRGAKIGTFVETKETTLGEGSKANHLSYLGDARIGRGVNVGAGTITCNWDGQEKHETVIDDDAYISSDTMLVAPVHIGERAATGAGSVVKGDVPADSLAVGAPARIIEGKGDKLKRRGKGQEPRQ
jgi:bifunctional UDP-N-acetylglucosamine pyrophosphorylase/glucosamine-1-phosphate N-acetyltransferase